MSALPGVYLPARVAEFLRKLFLAKSTVDARKPKSFGDTHKISTKDACDTGTFFHGPSF